MDRPHFTLTVATSSDAFIARTEVDAPQNWASPEEQALFFADVEAADWAIMGRHTHEAADKPHRRRIVFSRSKRGWIRPTQLWLDPEGLSAEDLAPLVTSVHPFGPGLVLGGTRVHDWFLAANAIDRVHLTVEPPTFGDGLPVFSGQAERNPVDVFRARGFDVMSERELNDGGTRYIVLAPKP